MAHKPINFTPENLHSCCLLCSEHEFSVHEYISISLVMSGKRFGGDPPSLLLIGDFTRANQQSFLGEA